MKYGTFLLDDAAGLILGHTVRGLAVLKKGRLLEPADIDMLRASGITSVVGARLEIDDVGEDAAAAQIASRLCGSQLASSPAHTGRCNLISGVDGVLLVDKNAVDAANRVSETITIATLPELASVRKGQIVATVKIIPFAVARGELANVESALGSSALQVAPYRTRNVALISTLLPGLKASVISSTEEVVRHRIESVGGTLSHAVRIDHETAAVAGAIEAAAHNGASLILIVGASATADRADVVPAGIVCAGGVIDHFGMPVDPGNLLVLGARGDIPVLVLPGCARSPKLNGVDWVLQRIAAEVPVTGREIMGMGVGGLLVDTPHRPLPRAQAVREARSEISKNVSAIVLAAGQSRRMGGRNKLLMEIEGVPLVRRTVETLLASSVSAVVVVTGHQSAEVEAAVKGLDVRIVHNPHYPEGLSTSLKAGLDAVDSEAAAALICLGDMPEIAPAHIARLVDGFDPEAGRAIGVPTHNGKRGNPVLWARRFFGEMQNIAGDVGARHLIGDNESLVYEVEFEDTGVLMDLDTPGQWDDYISSSVSRQE